MSGGFPRREAAEHLTSDEVIVAYLDACFDEARDDPALVLICLGDVARARGMPELAIDLGVSGNVWSLQDTDRLLYPDAMGTSLTESR
jgi:probable addiction module antidote protein